MSSESVKVMTIFSLVAGIIGIIFAFIPFAVYVGVPLSTAAVFNVPVLTI